MANENPTPVVIDLLGIAPGQSAPEDVFNGITAANALVPNAPIMVVEGEDRWFIDKIVVTHEPDPAYREEGGMRNVIELHVDVFKQERGTPDGQ